jgi:two-component system cell cycle sensor histidine kinase/response regulator CckA
VTHDGLCRTILVVEDNLDTRKLAQLFLENSGYTVITASDGEEGLRIYEEQHSSVGLLLSDVMIPNMNGTRESEPA